MTVAHPARAARGPARVKSRDPVRENLVTLFTRSHARAESVKRGSGRQVYRSALAVMRHLCAQPWAHATLFAGEVKLARQFLSETGLGGSKVKSLVANAVLNNIWASTWTPMLLEVDAGQFDSYCLVRGEELLREALDARKGVVLAHSHTLFTQLFWRWLEHRQLPEGITLWQWTWGRSVKDRDDPKLRAVESAREMLSASRLLRSGGIVHVLADGRRGGSGLILPFHGRARDFQPSFAELAILANSPVLPVDIVRQQDGHIRIEIGKPFEVLPATEARNARVEGLVRAYARHLAQRWARHADNLEWFQMRRQLRFKHLVEAKS